MNQSRICIIVLTCVFSHLAHAQMPSSYDLRNVNGTNYSTSVKSQRGGTCWTHGSMAAIEGNLIRHGYWSSLGYTTQPNLAEYHLDWWNGFNQHHNDDINPPTGDGLTVHNGGDYLVVAAYATRGDGIVYCTNANDGTQYDDDWYYTTPNRASAQYTRFYPRHIEWLRAGTNLQNIDTIKGAIISNGVLGTCMYYSGSYISGGKHYQPPSSSADPNHSIAIVGWDDNMEISTAPTSGAWLCKNSWGSGWNGDGHFWISYYDKHACQHPEMGAVTFRDVVQTPYDHTYYHDYHGWRDTLITQRAFNAFTALTNEMITAISFYTTTNDTGYTANLFGSFSGGVLTQLLWSNTGSFEHIGYHTVDVLPPLSLTNGQQFFLELQVDAGGQAYDRTSEISVLLSPGAEPPEGIDLETMGKMSPALLSGTPVTSSAGPQESYYLNGGTWTELTNLNDTANFCLKVFTEYPDFDDDGIPDDQDPDDDNDNIPDAWEIQYGMNPTNTADGTDDWDSDGFSNVEEFVADTNPTNATSRFEMTTPQPSPQITNSIVLQWTARTNRNYRIYLSTNLLNAFELISPTLLYPCNAYTDSLHNSSEHRYYRVQVEYAP